MRTLILLTICATCVILSVLECRDRSDRQKLVVHVGLGLVAALVIWKLIVWAGVFDRW